MKYKSILFEQYNEVLKNIWEKLEQECQHFVFQSYEWQKNWYNAIGKVIPNLQLSIIVIFENDIPVALFPFGIYKKYGLRCLEFLGGDQSDYNCFLVQNNFLKPTRFKEIWDCTLSNLPQHLLKNFCRIPGLIEDSYNPLCKIYQLNTEMTAHCAVLPNSIEAFNKRISKKMLGDNARMLRRLNEIGSASFLISDNVIDFQKIIGVLIMQKERRYLETGARNILADKNIRSYYEDLHLLFHEKKGVQISALMIDGEIIASHLGFVYRNRFYYLMPTFANEKWQKYSPGRLLLQHLIEWSIENGFKVFDFTTGSESYKKDWCDLEMDMYYLMEASGIYGIMVLKIKKWILLLKKNPKIVDSIKKLNKRFQFYK